MSLAAGSRLGRYEIVSPLGAGGMGEVYRARDSTLDRDVAIKILPDSFAVDPDRLMRFGREAKTLASLNHPHIAQIHGFEDAASLKLPGGATQRAPSYLVMELVEGGTLAERIARGPLPLDEALPIARQVAEALEAAHEAGIIHRDLKPANIKVRPDGTVKVLDFGLAKQGPSAASSGAHADAPGAVTSPAMTMQGVILGTAAYMSPEQAKGKPVDRRADIWAFGAVVYEMLTARRAFDGDDVTDTIVAVMSREPDWSLLPPATPPSVSRLLRRCLEKSVQRRLPHVGVARLEFDTPEPPIGHPEERRAAAASSASSRRVFAVAALALAVGIGVSTAASILWRPAPGAAQPVRFAFIPPPAQPFNRNGNYRNLAIAPDGKFVVYVDDASEQLMMRGIDQLEPVAIRGITGANSPFVSPDGQWIGFFTGLSGELKKVSVTGGLPIALCRYQGRPRGAAWSPDGKVVFATNDPGSGLFSVPDTGGEPTALTAIDPAAGEADHLFPSFVTGANAVLFTASALVGSAADARIAVLNLETGEKKMLVQSGSHAVYIRPGYLVYASAGTLRAVRFDVERLETIGNPVPVVEDVSTFGTGGADFDISVNGTLVYVPGRNDEGTPRSLVWVTRQGREAPIKAPVRAYFSARLSPDESRVAVEVRDQENDIWILDLARQTLTRGTFGPSLETWPIWTPDGRRIVFSSPRDGGITNLYSRAADGTGVEERLMTSPNQQMALSFTPDGRTLLVEETTPKTGADLVLVPLDTPARAEPLIQTGFSETNGELSPDGRWLAYASTESGEQEVYVRPFPQVNEGRWQVSTAGGSRPLWSHSGTELFYQERSRGMMAVPVQTSPAFRAGNPMQLFDWPVLRNNARPHDVTRDGQRFLMIKNATSDALAALRINVVVHWIEELEARVDARD